MKYRVLGTLQIADGDTYASLSARKIEQLLATLLVKANQVVSQDRIIEELWGNHPPRQATAGLYVYISQLRKLLAPEGGSAAGPLVTCSPGYLLQVADDELDLHVFRAAAFQGRSQLRAGRYEEAAASFESALDLWRGPALSELRDGPIVAEFVTWVDELRLECAQMCVEANLRLGHHRAMVSVLSRLIADHPLHEEFYQQLMLALYRSNRRADALRTYQLARETLNRELGLEPCRMLRELHQTILRADYTEFSGYAGYQEVDYPKTA
ncbi:BTAD domain-containing putative transcriptional regulator [Streptomyces sp. NPDC020983]|uniref:AfsR/SARP family transcriptional regulator n=1 Tax=Streptomyces sp. NPDC020983 TaxID=3365106 RepID=UPI00378B1308